MDWKFIITAMIAIYGAGLSTILAIRGLLKDKRNLAIFLEYIAFYEKAQIRLVNIGMRPITIISISMQIFFQNDGVNPPHWDIVPDKNLLDRPYDNPPVLKQDLSPLLEEPVMLANLKPLLPVHIKDGEQAILPIYDMTYKMLIKNFRKARIQVKDADGNIYKKFKSISINPKFETIPEVKSE